MAERPIYPVLLAGGGGARLWPLSQGERPKQFLKLATDQTLYQDALDRVSDTGLFAPPIVVGGARHAQALAEPARSARLVLEPFGRDTAAAVTAGLLEVQAQDPDALALLMPTDHAVGDVAAFHAAVRRAAQGAAGGSIVLFGITPDRPATGYGYIEPREGSEPVRPVARFVEKPDEDGAQALIARGCLWNSGMFLMPVRETLEEIGRLAPEVLSATRKAWETGARTGGELRLEADAFAAAPAISIDRAVMEKTSAIAVVEADMGWADLGSWSSLWSAGPRDGDDNRLQGDVLAHDSHGLLVRAEGLKVIVVGVEDLIVVATPDGVLVTRRGRDEEVKGLIAKEPAK